MAAKKGGIIWQTQGSGKSLIMVMLARWIREARPDARILVVTDRKELDDQIDLLRRCSGTVTILDTHHSTAPTHEEGGYAGHTFREIPEDHPTSLEDSPRAAWGNPTSFWATQPDLVRMLYDCGFGTVLALVPPTLPNRTFYLCLPRRAPVSRSAEATQGAA